MLTLGTIFSVIFGTIGLGLIALVIISHTKAKKNPEPSYGGSGYWDSGWSIAVALGSLFGLFFLIPAALGLIPYQWEYLKYAPISGEVERVESMRLEQNFVITFNGDPQPYKITDTRAALIEPGDTISLQCVKQFEWGSSNHGYDCRWD